MSIKYRIILLVSIFLATFMMGGFFLPSIIEVENEITINKSPEEIYPALTNLEQWQYWSIWSNRIDKTMKTEYVSATEMQWTAQHAGNGSLKISQLVTDSQLHTFLSVQEGKFELPGTIRLQVISANQTKVIWQNTIKIGNNPLKRYIGSSVQSVVHRDIGECLKGLEQHLK
jgi:hypothetical protein